MDYGIMDKTATLHMLPFCLKLISMLIMNKRTGISKVYFAPPFFTGKIIQSRKEVVKSGAKHCFFGAKSILPVEKKI